MRARHSDHHRTPTLLLVLLLFSVGMVGCATLSSQNGSSFFPSGNAAQPSAQIQFCDTPGVSCSPRTSFSIAQLRDLNIVVNWTNLAPGNHAQILTILHSPGGAYQSFHKGFIVASGANGSFSTSNSLPVAGTWIVQRSMVGTWTAEAFLDGHVVARQSVTLTR